MNRASPRGSWAARIQSTERRLHSVLLGSLRFACRSPRWAILVPMVVMVPALAGLFKLKTLLAMEDVVDPSLASKQELNVLMRDFRIHASSILTLRAPAKGWSEDELCRVNEWLTRQRVENPHLVSSFSAFDVRQAEIGEHHLGYPRILRLGCLSGEPRSAGADASQDLPTQFQNLLASPWAFSLVGKSGDDFTIQFDFHDAPDENRFGTFDPRVIEALHESFRADVAERSTLEPFWVGTSDFQFYFYEGMKRVNVLNLVLVAVLILSFKFIFGRWRAGVLYSGSVIASGLFCYGWMGIAKIPVDILSKNLFLMIAVAALEDFVYLAAKLRDSGGRWRETWRALLLPGFLTSFTTALGFSSLCISDLQIIRHFGLWAAVGSIAEWAVVFLVLPACFTLWPSWSRFVETKRPVAYRHFLDFRLLKIPKPLSFALLAVFLVAPSAFQHLNVKDVPLDMFARDHVFRRGVESLRERNDWESQVSLVFEPEIAPAEVRARVEGVRGLPEVTAVLGGEDFVESAVARAEKPATKALIRDELASASFMKNWISDRKSLRYALFLRHGDTESIERLQAGIRALCPNAECAIAGVPVVYAEFAKKVPETLLSSFLLSLVLVSLVLGWLSFCRGEIRNLPWILLSSFWGPAVTFVLIAVFAIKVNFLTCVFASVLVGLTGDNAIQFLVAAGRRPLAAGVNRGGAAALVSGFLMALSSLIFIGSAFIPPRIFGLLLMSGLLLSTLGDYWLLKAFVGESHAD